MQCPNCYATSRDGAKFCDECGSSLPRVCHTCGHATSVEVKFCAECGARLQPGTAAQKKNEAAEHSKSAPPTSEAPEAERRQITVLFADMVGSSALSTKLDPEDHREVVASFQAACSAAVARFDGMVAQYLGDGVLAYFGYPAAHEDDAERAVRSGLAVIEAVGALAVPTGFKQQTRVGIATGIVVVGDLVRESVTQQNAAIGETTNLAARLQALAEPNTIVIAPETYHLVGALFEYRELGPQRLKGFDDPVFAREVMRASEIENRFEARRREAVSRLQGRSEEIELLARRWQHATGGEGCVVLLTGEAGIGKSRLTRAFEERLAAEPHTYFTYHCSPYHQSSAFYPLIANLQRAAGINAHDAPGTKLDKLAAMLDQAGAAPPDEAGLFAALLSIPRSARFPLPRSTPQQLKERTLAAFISHLKRLSARRPVLILFEDLHWIDPTSLELLSRIVEEAPDLRLMLVATARPEFIAPWPSYRHVSTVGLSRINRAEGSQLVLDVAHGKVLPKEVVDVILARTDGVPLFIEELTKTVVESGSLREESDRYEIIGSIQSLAIPSSLHASLLARLDRLAPVREIAQIGSAIGREFTYGLIAAVAGRPRPQLQEALSELVKAGLIYQRGVPPNATYSFKHALMQDAAYATLLRTRRQKLHVAIAQTLQDHLEDSEPQMPEVLARHYRAAGQDVRAKQYWIKAGKQAIARCYYSEAASHISNALALLRKEPPSDARTADESELVLDQTMSIGASKGLGSAEIGELTAEAIKVSAPLGDHDLHFRAMWADWNFHEHRRNFHGATERAHTLTKMAERMGTSDAKLQACHASWSTDCLSGNIAAARAAAEQGLALYDFDTHREHHSKFGAHDPGVCAHGCGAFTFFQSGLPDRAEEIAAAGIELGNRLKHPFSQCLSYWTAGFVAMMAGEAEEARKRGNRLAELALPLRFATGIGFERIISGWATAKLDDPVRGLAQMEDGFNNFVDNNQPAWMTFAGFYIAEAKLAMGRAEEVVDFLETLQQIALKSKTQLFVSELQRLHAEALETLGMQAPQVEEQHRSALAIARQQGATMLELRAATSLARYWSATGHHPRARDLLAPLYSTMTEGFDTPDLRAARALLDQIGDLSTVP